MRSNSACSLMQMVVRELHECDDVDRTVPLNVREAMSKPCSARGRVSAIDMAVRQATAGRSVMGLMKSDLQILTLVQLCDVVVQ